jgi:hypothetical protein
VSERSDFIMTRRHNDGHPLRGVFLTSSVRIEPCLAMHRHTSTQAPSGTCHTRRDCRVRFAAMAGDIPVGNQ